MIDHQRGSRPPAATAFVLLALMLCGASTSVSAASWRPLHQSAAARSSGGATVAGNQLRKRSSGYARRYDPAGAQPSENYALADGLVNALRNSPYASHIPGSSEYESSGYLAAIPSGRRCSCQEGYGDYHSDKTPLTIMLWALLAIVAWYTPVSYQSSLFNNDNSVTLGRSDAYRQLIEGMSRWSGLDLSGASAAQGVSSRGRRSTAHRMRSSAGSEDVRAASEDVRRMRRDTGEGDYGHYYQPSYPSYQEECYCGNKGKARQLHHVAVKLLYNSYWIPLIGLGLLVAEEVYWYHRDAEITQTVFVNGIVSRTADYVQSLMGGGWFSGR